MFGIFKIIKFLKGIEKTKECFIKFQKTNHYISNHHGAEISVISSVERIATKLLILVRY